jgi:CAAX prenyl protease-like protein
MSFISQSPQAKAYLGPFLAFMGLLALGEIIGHLGEGFASWFLAEPRYWIYPLQTIVCAFLLGRFWSSYRFDWQKGWFFGLLVGVLVFGIWVSPQWLFHTPPRNDGFDPGFFGQGTPYWINSAVRVIRLVIVVPLLEEIFWRGFLLRYLIRDPFDQVPFGEFRWGAFLWVAGLFAAAHWGPDFWVALVTGALYNLVAIRTRSLGACVIAHALTNLLLGIYIFKTGQWGFW